MALAPFARFFVFVLAGRPEGVIFVLAADESSEEESNESADEDEDEDMQGKGAVDEALKAEVTRLAERRKSFLLKKVSGGWGGGSVLSCV